MLTKKDLSGYKRFYLNKFMLKDFKSWKILCISIHKIKNAKSIKIC